MPRTPAKRKTGARVPTTKIVKAKRTAFRPIPKSRALALRPQTSLTVAAKEEIYENVSPAVLQKGLKGGVNALTFVGVSPRTGRAIWYDKKFGKFEIVRMGKTLTIRRLPTF